MADTCRSCGAAVQWLNNERTGKLMIVDAMPSVDGNIEIVNGQARVHGDTFQRLLLQEAGEPLYADHHATCPDQAKWR